MSAIRILIVDDMETNRVILEQIIADMGYEPVLAESGEQALELLYEHRPYLVLSDISMPGMDGYELCRIIKNNAETRDIPVIFISAFTDAQDIVHGFSLGGDDYITKPFNILEVKARIKAIIRRTSPKPKEADKVIESGDMKLDCEGRRVYISGREINLTAKEFELLELLVVNANKVYSRENLLKLVWGSSYPGDVRTVDVHIRRLREKIESNPSEPKYVHTKWGVGYYFA